MTSSATPAMANPKSQTAAPILQASGLSKSFVMGDARVTVLKNCDFTLSAGEFVAIEGRSGSGKSTLLHILGCLDMPNSGSISYTPPPPNGSSEAIRDITLIPDPARALLRNQSFGFVFQFYHLLPELNVLENTLLGAYVKYSYTSWLTFKSPAKARAEALLEQLGLSHRKKHRPSQLSGGERQRVAIARALMNEPQILFADEPTGNLDFETGLQIMSVLNGLHAKGQTVVMVTHDRSLAKQADRALILRDGKLVLP